MRNGITNNQKLTITGMNSKLLVRNLYMSLSLAAIISLTAKAQTIDNNPNVTSRPTAHASSLAEVPVIDGDVLNEDLWKNLPPIDQLVQTKPNAGFPASEKTEVRIGYTATTFYLSVVC